MAENYRAKKFQLCWDCKYAIGGCNWADYGKPVKGWTATVVKANGNVRPYNTYFITACPQFEADARGGGLYKIEKG